MNYMIIDNNGRYWLTAGVSKEKAELYLADLLDSGIVKETDEAEIVEVEDVSCAV